MEQLIVSVLSGAVAGNLLGLVVRRFNLGLLGNTLAGIVGGGVLAQLLAGFGAGDMTEFAAGATDVLAGPSGADMLRAAATGGIGGLLATGVVGFGRSLFAR